MGLMAHPRLCILCPQLGIARLAHGAGLAVAGLAVAGLGVCRLGRGCVGRLLLRLLLLWSTLLQACSIITRVCM